MKTWKVLVNSAEPNLSSYLCKNLPSSRFSVVSVCSGVEFMERVRQERPEIAVLRFFPEMIQATQMAIAFLKDTCPNVRIIVVAAQSSDADALIVEQGVFYYMTAPVGTELVQVIEAATRSISRKTKPQNL